MILQSVVPSITQKTCLILRHIFFLTLNCHLSSLRIKSEDHYQNKLNISLTTNLPQELSAHVHTRRQSEKFPAVKDLRRRSSSTRLLPFMMKTEKRKNPLRHALFKTNFTPPIIYTLFPDHVLCEISHSSRHNNKRRKYILLTTTFPVN